MKKVLHIRLDAPQYSSEAIRKGFIENGYEHVGINWQQVKFDVGILGLEARMIQAAQDMNPYIIFIHIQNPGVIDVETCQELSKYGFTVLYTFDVREDIRWQQELAPYLGLVLFADMESVNDCKEKGIMNVDILQNSCDMGLYKSSQEPTIKYPQKIAFIGSNYVGTNLNFPMAQERLDMVNLLKGEYGDDFLVKGMNWPISESINYQQERDIYNSVEIAINQNNFDRELYTSDRLWRSMACGCFTLTKYFKGIEQIFKVGVHLDWWRTLDELKLKINYYLSNPDAIIKIGRQGMDHVRDIHTWANRIKELETLINKHGKPITATIATM